MEQKGGKGQKQKSSRQTVQQKIQDRERDVKDLHQELQEIQLSAEKAEEDSENVFNDLIHLVEKSCSDVKLKIKSLQKKETKRIRELQEKLQQDITLLTQLSDNEDHSQLLQDYPPFSQLSPSLDPAINLCPRNYFDGVTKIVSETRDQLQDILIGKGKNASGSQVDDSQPQPEPKTRAEFLKYSRDITLDPNTANRWLLLSEGNRKVTNTNEKQSYSKHPERFKCDCQVLSKESLTGRCYWEVEWGGGGGVCIAVAYKNMSRGGRESGFGGNEKSWNLLCDKQRFFFVYNKVPSDVSGPWSSKIGVYLDHTEGVLSFYSISETVDLIHRVETKFTQPLHAGLHLHYPPGHTAEFIQLK